MLRFHKVKTTHHILQEFHQFLAMIEKDSNIQRIIPGRISRKQSGSAGLRINFSYYTSTGLKYLLIKGTTAQEIFIICKKNTAQGVKEMIDTIIMHFNPDTR